MSAMLYTLLLLVGYLEVSVVEGHGRLMEPPARNSMWRLGYLTPVNYNDNELYCGGYTVMYEKNKGKCGICGDDWQLKQPRPHEAGGEYATGLIVRTYTAGQSINLTAQLTANHKGHFQAKLCVNNDPTKIIAKECLNANVLRVSGTSSTRFIIPKDSKKQETFTWQVDLPPYLTCTQCVIQWTYYAGNTWGTCEDGTEEVGCGPQETFVNCADIAITTNTGGFSGIVNAIDNPWMFLRKPSPQSTEIALSPIVIRSQVCLATGTYYSVPNMDRWCMENCLKLVPNCPPDKCKCVSECKAIGDFSKKQEADIYCLQNCLTYPKKCNKDRCECF